MNILQFLLKLNLICVKKRTRIKKDQKEIGCERLLFNWLVVIFVFSSKEKSKSSVGVFSSDSS